jgi:hypothetical protein
MDLTPSGRHKDEREIHGRRGKKDKIWRVYTKEFSAEAAVPAEKNEKPASQVAGVSFYGGEPGRYHPEWTVVIRIRRLLYVPKQPQKTFDKKDNL